LDKIGDDLKLTSKSGKMSKDWGEERIRKQDEEKKRLLASI
jgi:hypothetical protein